MSLGPTSTNENFHKIPYHHEFGIVINLQWEYTQAFQGMIK